MTDLDVDEAGARRVGGGEVDARLPVRDIETLDLGLGSPEEGHAGEEDVGELHGDGW